MIEWLIAAAVFLLLLGVLPGLLRRTRNAARSSGGSGVVIAIGMAFSTIFDPKASQAIEVVERKNDLEDEDGESDQEP